MRLKLEGSLSASHKMWRYLMCVLYMTIRELKIYSKAYCLRKRLLTIRITRPNLGLVQSLRRSAMVLMVFFSWRMSFKNYWWLRPWESMSCLTFFYCFYMKLIMPFPKFLGMFFVSFLEHRWFVFTYFQTLPALSSQPIKSQDNLQKRGRSHQFPRAYSKMFMLISYRPLYLGITGLQEAKEVERWFMKVWISFCWGSASSRKLWLLDLDCYTKSSQARSRPSNCIKRQSINVQCILPQIPDKQTCVIMMRVTEPSQNKQKKWQKQK